VVGLILRCYNKCSMKPACRLLACLAISFAYMAAEATGFQDQLVRSFMEKEHVPGLAFVVVQNGRIVSSNAYGLADVKANTPLTLNSVFPIASVSKPVVAIGVLSLIEKGLVKLTDPIGKYVADLPLDWQNIAISRVLDHTSGIPDHFNGGKFDVDSLTPISSDELIKKLITLPLSFKPGEKYKYSNGNYALLAKLIEKVSGRPHEEYLAERIFKPLGMSSTKALRLEDMSKVVQGYVYEKASWQPKTFNPDWCFGNGALCSTVLDLAKLDAALYTQRVLKTATLEQMTTPLPRSDGKLNGYALGWEIASKRNSKLIAHTGKVGGWRSYYGRYAEYGLTVIVIANQADIDLDILVADLAGTIQPALALQPIRDDYPDTTRDHQAFIESIVQGTVDASRLSPPMKEDYTSKKNWSDLQDKFKKAGAITAFLPVERKIERPGVYYSRYRVEQGRRVWAIWFTTDDSGFITGLMVSGA
jgi:D-alanyl-D-alanine carboxypeptidase